MKKIVSGLAFLMCLLVAQGQNSDLLISNVNYVDVENGRIKQGTILISNGKISAIKKRLNDVSVTMHRFGNRLLFQVVQQFNTSIGQNIFANNRDVPDDLRGIFVLIVTAMNSKRSAFEFRGTIFEKRDTAQSVLFEDTTATGSTVCDREQSEPRHKFHQRSSCSEPFVL